MSPYFIGEVFSDSLREDVIHYVYSSALHCAFRSDESHHTLEARDQMIRRIDDLICNGQMPIRASPSVVTRSVLKIGWWRTSDCSSWNQSVIVHGHFLESSKIAAHRRNFPLWQSIQTDVVCIGMVFVFSGDLFHYCWNGSSVLRRSRVSEKSRLLSPKSKGIQS